MTRRLSALLALGELDQAGELVESYRERDPACHEAGLAALALHHRDAAACRRHAEAAHRLDPDDPVPLHYLSAACILVGDLGTAEVYARKAVERGGSARSRLSLANLLVAAGKLSDAEELFRRVLRRDSGNAEALRGLGLLLGKQRSYGEAIRSLAQAFELRPEDDASIQGLINLFAEMGRVLGAIAAVRAVQEQNPPEGLRATLDLVHLELSRMLSDAYPARSVVAGADEAVDALLRSSLGRPARVRLRVASTLLDIERHGEAGELLSQLDRQPLKPDERSQLLFLRGLLAERSGQPTEALAAYVAAVEADGRRGTAYCNAVALLLARGDDEALTEIGRLMTRVPDEAKAEAPQVFLNEAIYQQRLGNPAEARRLLHRLQALAGDNPELGSACQRLLAELADG